MFYSRSQQAFNPDKENPHLQAKTPGRNVLAPKSTQISRQYPQTGGKLAPGTSKKQAPATVFKDVNLLATGRKLGGTSSGKGGQTDDVAKLLFKEAGPSTTKTPAFKTPFANKLRPSSRVPAIATPLPSAQRARRKSRQSQSSPAGLSSRGSVDTSLHLLTTPGRELLGPGSFVTPERAHRSPSLSVGDVSFEDAHSVALENLVEEDEESDVEVEYMPPKVVPLPDAPPFDFVPLKEIGERFMAAKGRLPNFPEQPGEVELIDPYPTEEELGAGWTDEWQSGLKTKANQDKPAQQNPASAPSTSGPRVPTTSRPTTTSRTSTLMRPTAASLARKPMAPKTNAARPAPAAAISASNLRARPASIRPKPSSLPVTGRPPAVHPLHDDPEIIALDRALADMTDGLELELTLEDGEA